MCLIFLSTALLTMLITNYMGTQFSREVCIPIDFYRYFINQFTSFSDIVVVYCDL
jgi:hypothetical protein